MPVVGGDTTSANIEGASDPCQSIDGDHNLLCAWFPRQITGNFLRGEKTKVDAVQTNFFNEKGKLIKVTFHSLNNSQDVFLIVEYDYDPKGQLAGNQALTQNDTDLEWDIHESCELKIVEPEEAKVNSCVVNTTVNQHSVVTNYTETTEFSRLFQAAGLESPNL